MKIETIEDLRKIRTYTYYDYFFKIAAYQYFNGENKWAIRLKAQGLAESGLTMTQNAQSGAYGVMQVMPATFEWLTMGRLEISDPYANIMVGSALMAHYMGNKAAIKDKEGRIVGAILSGFKPLRMLIQDEYERWKFALAGYNCGIGHITGKKTGDCCWKILERQGEDYKQWENCAKVLYFITGKKNANETINYVNRILHYAKLMEEANEIIVD